VGVDRWPAAIARAGEKARARGTQRIGLAEADAAKLPFRTAAFDLVVSNLGLNSFEDAGDSLAECRRVLRPGGALVIATSLRGTFAEFYGIYDIVLEELGLDAARRAVAATDERRMTVPELTALLRGAGFHDPESREDTATWRFADGSAFLDHWFIRLGFLPSWTAPLPEAGRGDILAALRLALDAVAMAAGGLRLTVPLAVVSARR
jgi:SAM-dependent methyltransferase